MAPPPVTEDFYKVLEVSQTATLDQIIQSYRRQALKLHPDRNANHNATQAFQLLVRAYETLKDDAKRRDYDRVYPTIKKRQSASQGAQAPRSSTSSTESETLSETAQLAALAKSKQERVARWQTKKQVFDFRIQEIQKQVRRLELDIKTLESIAAAEAAAEAQKNSWGAWLLSPIYKRKVDTEVEKALKDREKQERRIEKDMKERRLETKKGDVREQESLLKKAKEEADAAIAADDKKKQVIESRRYARELRARQERERAQEEIRTKLRKQQQEEQDRWNKEVAEKIRRQQAAARAAEEARLAELRAAQAKRQEKAAEDLRKRAQAQRASFASTTTRNDPVQTSGCIHEGWWDKIHGRAPCPECYDVWNFLLECPGCPMQACPKCQSNLRPRLPRRQRTPSPEYSYADFDWD
ncbi:hypothetical protein BDU57DRAFT_486702 [Ampelomyces quisqualis]|uniref:J domain-containing protein n=1 Tax=Ampelomyces quisqualis TaxID=50730 RepID=A0A6A5QXP6_AMPQU|nr:hypothetical protein BDU57DRAFT_486702 [Ampelomyces quisqualis]